MNTGNHGNLESYVLKMTGHLLPVSENGNAIISLISLLFQTLMQSKIEFILQRFTVDFNINGIIIKPTLMNVEISISFSCHVAENNKTKSRDCENVCIVYGFNNF